MEEFKGKKRATKKSLIFVMFGLVLFFVFLYFFNKNSARAAVAPMIITYQGKLLISSRLATTTQNMYFVLYDAATAGNILYTASGTIATPQPVSTTPTQGLFSINLGDTGTNAISSTIFRDNASVFLEVRIGADTLTPRKRITSVPYAFNSRFLDGVPGDTLSTTTYIPISDSSGNFRFNSTTITTSTITNLTATSITSTNLNISGQTNLIGRVGINSTSPIASLALQGTAGTNLLEIASSTGASLLRILTNGNVGINSSSPIDTLAIQGGLQVVGGVTSTNLYISGITNLGATTISSLTATNVTSTNVSSTNSYSNSYTGTWNGNLLSILVGGTNSSTIAANGSIIYADGTRYNASAVGSSGQILQSAGSGTPVWVTTTTLGFVNLQGATSGTQQTGHFNISGTGIIGTSLGINTTTPIASLAVQGTAGSNLFSFNSSTGNAVLTLKQDGNLYTGGTGFILYSGDQGSNIQLTNSAGVIISGVGAKLLLAGTSPYFRAYSAGQNVGMRGNMGTAAGVNAWIDVEDPRSNTSGTSTNFQIRGAFNPTSGTGDFIGMDVAPTVSTTGSYAGANTTLFRVSPLLTSATSTFTRLVDVGTNSAANGAGAHTSLFVIDKNGRVGINSSSPIASLAVQGTGTQNPFEIASSTGATLLRILTNGNVGINSSSPIDTLAIQGGLQVVGGVTSTNLYISGITNLGATTISSLTATNVTSTNVSSTNSYSNSYTGTWNGNLLSILVGGTNSSTIAANGSIIYSDGARYNASAVGASGQILQSAGSGTPVWVTTTTLGFVNLQGATSGTQQTGHFNISGTGIIGTSLGINTTTPIASLAVQGTGGTNLLEIASSTGASLLRILTNGNVGINSSTPSTKLAVGGTSYFSQTSTFGGNISNIVDSNTLVSQITSITIGNNPQSIFVSGRYAYVANNASSTISVIDVSNPSVPVSIATTSVGSNPRSIYVSGRYGYTANYTSNTISVVDISNPFAPRQVATTSVGTGPTSIFVSGRYAYVANIDSDTISVVDISNPLAPTQVATTPVGTNPRSIFVSGRYAYVANQGADTISVIDISSPEVPIQIATTPVGKSPRFIYISGRYAYTTNNTSNTISVVDISNPLAPTQVATTSVGTSPTGIFVSGRYAYVTNQSADSISVIDVSNPSAPTQITTVTVGLSPFSIFVSGRYAYTTNVGNNSLSVVDISGTEVTSLIAHSAEVGNIQSRNDIFAQGNIMAGTSLVVGAGGIQSQGSLSVFASSTGSTSSIFSIDSAQTSNIFKVFANGRVGIGTSTPQAKLTIQGAGTENPFSIVSSTVGATSMFTVLTNGNVGINSSSPIASFAVQGNNGTNPFEIASSTGSTLMRMLTNGYVGIGTATPTYTLDVRQSATLRAPIHAGVGDKGWYFNYAEDGNYFFSFDNAYNDAGSLIAKSTSGSAIQANNGNTNFYTFTGATVGNVVSLGSTKFALLASGGLNLGYTSTDPGAGNMIVSGKVGVGTTSVAARLTIQGAGTENPFSIVTSTAAAGSMFTVLTNGDVGINSSTPMARLSVQGTAGTNLLEIASSTGASLLRILTNGNVGINSSTPSTKLAVEGTSYFSQTSTFGGNISNIIGSNTVISQVATVAVELSPQSVFVSGRYAYAANNVSSSISVIDISNPLIPVQIATTSVGTNPTSIYVSGRYAYTSNAGSNNVSVIDISNPFAPKSIATATIGGGTSPQSIYVSGRYAYVANSLGNSMSVVDISNPLAPIRIATVAVGVGPKSIFVSGRYAYTANQNDNNITVVDISNPFAPVQIASTSVGSEPQSVYVSGRYAYTANQLSNNISIVDISNPSAPTSTATLTVGTNPYSIFVSGRYAYVANNGSDNISVVDISSSTAPVQITTTAVGDQPFSIYVSGRYAYVANVGPDTISVVDISGTEVSSLMAHSAEVGNIQSRNDIFAQGNIMAGTSLVVGAGGIQSQGSLSVFASSTGSTSSVFSIDSAQTSNIFKVFANGTVGIGTSTPLARLFVQGAGTENPFSIVTSTAGAASMLTVLTNGNVGINSSSPIASLAVQGTGGTNLFSFASSTGAPLLTLKQNGQLYTGGTSFILHSGDETANIQFTNSAGIVLSGVGSKVLMAGTNPYFRVQSQGQSLGMRGSHSLTAAGVGVFIDNEDPRGNTSGTSTHFIVRGTFNPSSGTGDHISLDVATTVSTTGSYAGANTTILRVSPLLTSATSTNTYLVDVGTNSAANGAGAHTSLFVINSAGRVGIGTTTPTYTLSVTGTVAFANLAAPSVTGNIVCYAANGELRQQATNCTVSSARFKENIQSLSTEKLMEKVRRLRAISFDFRAKDLNGLNQIPNNGLSGGGKESSGFIAEEIALIDPMLVVYTDSYTPEELAFVQANYPSSTLYKDGKILIPQTVDYARVSVLLTGALQDIDTRLAVYASSTATMSSVLSIDTSSGAITVGSSTNPYNFIVTGNISMSGNSAINKLSFATSTLFESNVASFSGAGAFILNALNFTGASADNYIISLRANNSSVFSVAANGDVRTLGNYYGASAVLGTSTNPGDLAERVDLAIDDTVEPGDVMVVDKNAPDTYRRSGSAYEQAVAGIISSNPTIIVGNGKTDYTAVMAMVGRVPVKVTNANGNIQRGDLLITASTTGFAMKYDPTKDNNNKMVAVIGVALESLSASTGKVLALIRTGWIYNRDSVINNIENNITQLAAAQGLNLNPSSLPDNLNIANSGGQLVYAGGNLDLQNNSIINVATIIGKDGKWRIDEWGNLIQKIATAKGDKEIYGLQSTGRQEVVISGTSTLENGYKKVLLTELDQEIVDKSVPLKVSITMSGETKGVYVTEKNYDSFAVKENENGQSSAEFDWIVIAKILPVDAPPAVVPVEEILVSTAPVSEILETSPLAAETLSTTPAVIVDSATTTEVSIGEVSSSSVAMP